MFAACSVAAPEDRFSSTLAICASRITAVRFAAEGSGPVASDFERRPPVVVTCCSQTPITLQSHCASGLGMKEMVTLTLVLFHRPIKFQQEILSSGRSNSPPAY